MSFNMTPQIKAVIMKFIIPYHSKCLERILIRNIDIRTRMTRHFTRFRITTKAIKPRHIFIAAVSTTVVAGAAASLGLAGLALSGAHSAVFSHKGNNISHQSGDVGMQENDNDSLPTEYDVSVIQAYWRKRPTEVLLRMTEVAIVFAPYITRLLIWEYLVRRKIRKHEGLQQKYAVELREKLTKLGPCFVKFGQALSIRPDVLPSSFLIELQKLCDAVPSFPTKEAIEVIDMELGSGSAQSIFQDFNPNTSPIAAASLGQVYKLRLKEISPNDKKRGIYAKRDERWVAVKVQRPDMIRSILKDLFIMRILAGILEKVTTTITKQQPYNVALLDTFAAASLEEVNYIKEAENQERFRTDLVPRMGGRIYIPVVYNEFTTRKVIVTEWVEGKKLASSSPDVIERLTKVGIECFLCQLLETGYFHADPHPGNLLVTKNGKLAIIDFGLCEHVPLPDTKTLTLAIVHLMQGDVTGLILDAVDLQFLPKDVDIEKLRVDLQGVFDGAQTVEEVFQTVTSPFSSDKKYTSIASRRKKFWAVSKDLNKIFFNYPFLVPDYFALMTRAMLVLEGIAVTGDPEFDIFSASYPYAFKIALKVFGVRDLSEIAKQAVIAQRKIKSQAI